MRNLFAAYKVTNVDSIATVTAAFGTGLAASMYLEAKFAILKDIKALNQMRINNKMYLEAVMENRLSPYYLFENSVRQRLESECIWSRDGCFSWSQTYDNVNRYGHWFYSKGVQANQFVALYMTNSPDLLFAWLGLWSIGAAPAMINYNLTGNALLHCLKISNASIILSDQSEYIQMRIEEVRNEIEIRLGMKIVLVSRQLKHDISQFESTPPDDFHRSTIRGNSPTAMFFTSGTTGLPKGVPFNVDRCYRFPFNFLSTHDRWYNCMPLYHATGGVTALSSLMTGISQAIGKKFSTSMFWREVYDSQATWIVYVGELARYLLAAPPSPLDRNHNLRGMFGNGLRPDVWYRFRDRFNVKMIVEFFSSSEGVFGLINHCRGDYLATAVGHYGAIARFLSRDIIVPILVDEGTGDIVRNSETGFGIRQPYSKGGEIIVKVEDTEAFAGYYRDSMATQKKFAHNVFKKGDIWYRTGDSLRRTSDGRWFFVDRLGDTFRWKGENVSTAEVSSVLGQYPGIAEANVYGVSLPCHDGKVGCAAIHIEPGYRSSFNYADFLQYNRKHLPSYAVPVFLRLLKQLSHTHNFKQNKTVLRAEGVDPDRVKSGDTLLWIGENGRGIEYETFRREDWESLKYGKARL